MLLIDTSLCFEADQSVMLTHVELYLARAVLEGSASFFGIYEVPRYQGDEPKHPLELRALPAQKFWTPDKPGRLLHEQALSLPTGSEGRVLVELRPKVHLGGVPVCCGFRFGQPTAAVPFEMLSRPRLSAWHRSAWPPVLWASTEEPTRICEEVQVSPFHTPRAMSWSVHFEAAPPPTLGLELESVGLRDKGAAVIADLREGCFASPNGPAANGEGPPQLPGLPEPLVQGRIMEAAVDVGSAGAWPVAEEGRAVAWRSACKKAAMDDDVFATFRQSTKHGDIGIISDPLAEEGPLTADCLLREVLEDEREGSADSLGELMWRTSPLHDEPIAAVGGPDLVQIAERWLPKDLLWPLIIVKWLSSRFGSLRGFDVLEIGAGFGGLASVLLRTFAARSYSIVDLPEAQLLQRRFLASIGPSARYAGKLAFVGAGLPPGSNLLEHYDLFISVCAFSELSVEVQERYFDELISRSERGLIVDNRYTAAASKAQRLDMSFAGLALLDRLLGRGFHAEARTWHSMLPFCETCTPLNLVIFYERRTNSPCHTTSPELLRSEGK